VGQEESLGRKRRVHYEALGFGSEVVQEEAVRWERRALL
jgi:hypothetical protein